MRIIYKNMLFAVLFGVLLSSCVTGNDDNAVLREHEEALAKTPRVLNLLINGQEKTRDQLSVWEDIVVNPGDQVAITATLNSGNGATASTFHITRNYYHTSTSLADVETLDADLEAGAALDDVGPLDGSTATKTFGAGSTEYSFTYTVPAIDDAGDDFVSGDHINVSFWATNDTGGVGYQDFNLIME